MGAFNKTIAFLPIFRLAQRKVQVHYEALDLSRPISMTIVFLLSISGARVGGGGHGPLIVDQMGRPPNKSAFFPWDKTVIVEALCSWTHLTGIK